MRAHACMSSQALNVPERSDSPECQERRQEAQLPDERNLHDYRWAGVACADA